MNFLCYPSSHIVTALNRPCWRCKHINAARGRMGFSLVEVTMAIGIVAFAFISMLGLIPSGMNTFHKAMDASITSKIVQRIINDAQQTDFNKLIENEYPDNLYFDDQGNELTASQKTRAVYHVKMRVLVATTFPGNSAQNTNLATVTTQVANNPGNIDLDSKIQDTNPTSPFYKLWRTNAGISIVTQSAMVACNTSTK